MNKIRWDFETQAHHPGPSYTAGNGGCKQGNKNLTDHRCDTSRKRWIKLKEK